MVVAVSIENAHEYGDIIPSIYRLRHQAFQVRQSYDVPFYNGMEYDVYDTPATTYLACRDDAGVVRGCTRLFPTTRPYMIENIWPDAITSMPLPHAENIWECSRFCIDKNQPVHVRRKIHGELLISFLEFGLVNNIAWMIGVMTPPIWKAVFIRSGWPIEFLGPLYQLNQREGILVGKMDISEKILTAVRQKFGVEASVFEENKTKKERKRA